MKIKGNGMKFKVGDTVKIMVPFFNNLYKIGSIVLIEEVSYAPISVRFENGEVGIFKESELELIYSKSEYLYENKTNTNNSLDCACPVMSNDIMWFNLHSPDCPQCQIKPELNRKYEIGDICKFKTGDNYLILSVDYEKGLALVKNLKNNIQQPITLEWLKIYESI